MNCEQSMQLISAKLDGALTEREAEQLKEHLETCPACRALEAQLTALQSSLDDMEELQAPDGFADGVMRQIRAGEETKNKVIPLFRRPQVRALAGLAACAVLCVGLMKPEVHSGQDAAGMMGQEVAVAAAVAAPKAPPMPASFTEAEYTITDNERYIGPTIEAQVESTDEAVSYVTAAVGGPIAPTAPSHYAFGNDQYLRVAYGSTPEAPTARVLGSVDSLAEFLAQFPEDNLRDLTDAYGEEYFQTGRLLAVVLEEGSGSVRHAIAPQGLEWETVTILRQEPEAGTCDMAAWLVVAELDTRFEDGHTFFVIFG